jgi:lysine-ketoglutarate reductase/saccharopine dehydrogenase-like protein (TIGR00300 family)
MCRVRKGDRIVIGHRGVRVLPLQRETEERDEFEFMASAVSSEKPKAATVRHIAAEMRATRAAGSKILLVAGPALVHTGSAEYVVWMIRNGFVQVLFAGNALAAHDIEHALFGTSLGVYVDRGTSAEKGHEHHLRAINTIRRLGGIGRAVESGALRSGILYECVRSGVEFVLAGSIRDDGPLPEVITDVLEAQDRMRAALPGVGFCLMIATTLHAIATGNLLPASVRTVCVDINPATVTKLADRGTFQSIGVVTDVEPFLRALVQELGKGP